MRESWVIQSLVAMYDGLTCSSNEKILNISV